MQNEEEAQKVQELFKKKFINKAVELVCLASKIKIDVSRCLFRSVFKELLGRSFATSLC